MTVHLLLMQMWKITQFWFIVNGGRYANDSYSFLSLPPLSFDLHLSFHISFFFAWCLNSTSTKLHIGVYFSTCSTELVVLWDVWGNCKGGACHLSSTSTSVLLLQKPEFQIRGLWNCSTRPAWSICQCHFHVQRGNWILVLLPYDSRGES